jgi:NAD-dependent SIR2 family protein deacetylase
MTKTVYILGAGFSKPAKAPIQSEIIQEIISLRIKQFGSKDKTIKNYLDDFEKFLENELFIDRDDFNKVALEDVFTPIDRCIIDGISFRSLDNKKLIELREKIYSLIIIAIKEKLKDSTEQKQYIDKFARYLIRQMKPRMENKKHDPVAVISTNWDILLDNSIKRAIEIDNNNGVVDYCCYISSLDDDDTIKPGLWALGKGKYNVKLLKIHGSMNWLNCPKCQRLYVAFYDKIAESGIYKDKNCNHCNTNFRENRTNSTALRSNLIMPTFLKDLNNFQIKLIWQNAGVELSEADKVVFMGYSLPQADYELRQLLSRMIPHNSKIEVVMRDEKDEETGKIVIERTIENDEILNRYKTFFGKRQIMPYREGVVKYIDDLIINEQNASH